MDCLLARCLSGLVLGRWFSVFLPPQFWLLELQVKTVTENEGCFFLWPRKVDVVSKAVSKAKCWTLREGGLPSLMESSFILASLSSDHNLFLVEGL